MVRDRDIIDVCMKVEDWGRDWGIPNRDKIPEEIIKYITCYTAAAIREVLHGSPSPWDEFLDGEDDE